MESIDTNDIDMTDIDINEMIYMCSRCHKLLTGNNYRMKNNKLMKTCNICFERCRKKISYNPKCKHNKHKQKCKQCNDPIQITIKKMISGSKINDKKKNRYDEKNFIDYYFIENLITTNNNKCYYCKVELQYILYQNNLATIERLDNLIGHIKENCVVACLECNCGKR